MENYSITIIDDSLTSILTLKKLILKHFKNIKKISYSLSIGEGVLEVLNNKPNIVIFDVMFGDLIVFDFLDLFTLDGVSVIITSSERDFAINAFQKNAIDFILKPYRDENVILSINKVINFINKTNNNEDSENSFDFLAIPSVDKVNFIEMKDILFCMADGKYTTFFLAKDKKIVSSKNLGKYEKLLNKNFFYRIHHRYIINIMYLESIIKKEGAYCELVNRVTIPIAKRRQEDFHKFIRLKS